MAGGFVVVTLMLWCMCHPCMEARCPDRRWNRIARINPSRSNGQVPTVGIIYIGERELTRLDLMVKPRPLESDSAD
jgi:hypothetical protein